jgi:hypothetical protein
MYTPKCTGTLAVAMASLREPLAVARATRSVWMAAFLNSTMLRFAVMLTMSSQMPNAESTTAADSRTNGVSADVTNPTRSRPKVFLGTTSITNEGGCGTGGGGGGDLSATPLRM